MNIRALRYFLAVVNEGSYSKAAELLHITQPSISRQVMELEAELGEMLLIREPRGIKLTQQGRFLKQRAEEILELVDKTREEFRTLGGTLTGSVTIGGGETLAVEELAKVLSAVRAEYPDIHFHLTSGNAEDVVERLEKGLLDFALVIEPFDTSPYESLRIPYTDVWGLLMPEDAPLAAKRSITKEDLIGLPLMCSRQAMYSPRMGNAFQAWFGDTLERLNIVGTFNLIFNAALMVRHGLGYAIGLDKLLSHSEAGSGLVFRPFEPALTAESHLIWKRSQIFSPASVYVLNQFKRTFSSN